MPTGSHDGPLGRGGANVAAVDPAAADLGAVDPAASEQALQKALDLSYAFINRRERTVAEVRSQLERKGVSEADADAAVDLLIEQHLLDDERFAQLFISDKRELERWGAERIRRGLSARGIDRGLAERALAAADAIDQANLDSPRAEHCGDPHGGELARALELLRRRFPDPPRARRDRDRALGMLLRKGYEHELAIDALDVHTRER
jgi:regulatory protein